MQSSRAAVATNLEPKGSQLQYELDGKHRGEDHVQYIQRLGVHQRLAVKLHTQRDGID